jgi:2-oxoglutarate dehydrogenase E2 component (dihydrolipoamide succinyltransferase)
MPIRIVVPELGESVVEATVARWLKREGDRVAVGEAVAELETDKVNLEVGAERTGVLVRIERKEGEDVRVGDVLGVIEEAPVEVSGPPQMDDAISSATKEAEAPPQEPMRPPEKERAKATPVAKSLAQAHGVDPAQVPASGPGGRPTKEDILSSLERQKASRQAEIPATPAVTAGTGASQPVPAAEREGRDERVRMSRRRQTIARRLVEAQHTAAMLTTFNEIDMSAVMEIRRRGKESFQEQHGVSLGIMPFFVRAAIGALKRCPRLNAEVQGDEMLLKRYYDIGIAIAATEGLVVPMLRDADRMSFAEIEKAIDEYVRKAEKGALSLEDLRGGTFTITNGGVFGTLLSTPILNPPQVGILGLHKIEDRPIARGGEIVIRPMMYVALSFDHRIVDGREASLFLGRVKELIEDSEALWLER